MSWLLTNFVSAFLLPPLSLLLLALTGLLLWHKRPRIARTLLGSAFILLWLLSTPFLSDALLHRLEVPHLSLTDKTTTADAIVVLGGGTYFNAPEYANDTVGNASLERIRYAAKLHKITGKPILLTGGTPLGNSISEAALMKVVLEHEFNTPVEWIEEKSDNTFENARNSHRLLQSSGIKRIFLVTHAWHMPRALRVFQAVGFDVIPAPTAYTTRYKTDLMTFIPNADALVKSRIYLHEIIGNLWYRLKS
jgi:uncharacterized SAM-binding protein YcdF (DUF218 family)